jgi:hypothetical protein
MSNTCIYVESQNINILISLLVGFGLACAPVRCAHPSFWTHCNAQWGAARPPPAHRSFAAPPQKIKSIKLCPLAPATPFPASLILPVILWGPNYVRVRPFLLFSSYSSLLIPLILLVLFFVFLFFFSYILICLLYYRHTY